MRERAGREVDGGEIEAKANEGDLYELVGSRSKRTGQVLSLILLTRNKSNIGNDPWPAWPPAELSPEARPYRSAGENRTNRAADRATGRMSQITSTSNKRDR